MGSSRRVIALQTIVVSVLAVIVVVTLLKPEDSGMLSGVTEPAGPGPSTSAPGAYPPRGDGSRRHDARHGNDGGAGGPAVGGSVPSTSAAPITPAASPAVTIPGTGGGEGSPSDDQYADTLSRITSRLN